MTFACFMMTVVPLGLLVLHSCWRFLTHEAWPSLTHAGMSCVVMVWAWREFDGAPVAAGTHPTMTAVLLCLWSLLGMAVLILFEQAQAVPWDGLFLGLLKPKGRLRPPDRKGKR